jgi:hypothetical protein
MAGEDGPESAALRPSGLRADTMRIALYGSAVHALAKAHTLDRIQRIYMW